MGDRPNEDWRDRLPQAGGVAADAAARKPRRNVRRRFRPQLLPTVGTLIVVVATVALGNWQRARGEYKAALAAEYQRAAAASPVELNAGNASRIGSLPTADLRFRPVRLSGTFVPEAQMLLDNRVLAGRAGYAVLTPMRLSGSSLAVLVDRGWVPIGRDRAFPPNPPPPGGEIALVGRMLLPPPAGGMPSQPEGRIWQRIDFGPMARATGLALLPVVVEQTAGVSPADGLIRQRSAPDFGITTHRTYMVQWYSLAGLAIVLWLGLNWRREASDAAG